ncbi:hypothetical protein INQ10_24420, partial [Escherichia coli]|nr:hypothetical protein [Escherichia coli]
QAEGRRGGRVIGGMVVIGGDGQFDAFAGDGQHALVQFGVAMALWVRV